MTAITMNYVVAPFGKFWKRLERLVTVIGYSRAASELARQGHTELAKKLMLQRNEL